MYVVFYLAPTAPVVKPRWNDSTSSCVASKGYHVDISILETFEDRLKALIPTPARFKQKYASPCWLANLNFSQKVKSRLLKSSRRKLDANEGKAVVSSVFSRAPKSLVCVPQVYFMGFPRSGSTQLYTMLTKHPLVVGGTHKEPHFWSKCDFSTEFPYDYLSILRYFAFYQDTFSNVTREPKTQLIDGSQSLIWDTRKTGNLCFLPQIFADMLPTAKFIVLMRDPVERLYSDFNYLCEVSAKEHSLPREFLTDRAGWFHKKVVTELEIMEQCLRVSSLEDCTHQRLSGSGDTLCGHVRLGISFYHVHIWRWLREIPRKQFLFLTTAELAVTPFVLLEKVWDFLGLPSQDAMELVQVLYKRRHESEASKRSIANNTRALLRNYFQPHNDALATLLGERKFKFLG